MLVQGYHPGFEDDAYYLAAIKNNLNPALFPHDADFFRVLFQATAFDKLIALSIRWTHVPLAWGLFFWQMRRDLSGSLGMLANRPAMFPRRVRAVGRGSDGCRAADPSSLRLRIKSDRSAPASARAGDSADPGGDRGRARRKKVDRGRAAVAGIPPASQHDPVRRLLLRVSYVERRTPLRQARGRLSSARHSGDASDAARMAVRPRVGYVAASRSHARFLFPFALALV